jgi:antitoxin CptB
MKKIDILRKRLLYQSQHRGLKEMDLILGGFAEQFLSTMNTDKLLQFEDLLAFSDQELYGWLFERTSLPKNAPGNLINLLHDFIRTR